MKKSVPGFYCTTLFLLLSMASVAQDRGSVACDPVRAQVQAGTSAADMVKSVMVTGVSLAEATVLAMNCTAEDSWEAIAVAGVAMADNLAQAQSVADAVLASAGQTGAVADAVQVALQDYIKHMPQPDVYEDEYTPTGGSAVNLPSEFPGEPPEPAPPEPPVSPAE